MANTLNNAGLHSKECSDGDWPCNTWQEITPRLEYTWLSLFERKVFTKFNYEYLRSRNCDVLMSAFLKRGITVHINNRVPQVESGGLKMTTTGLTVTAPSVEISDEDR
jgi:hypothetical protein